MKKEIVYTVAYRTEEEIKKAKELQSTLYEFYNIVDIYPNGTHEVRIIAEDENTHVKNSIRALVEYLYNDELKHYLEENKPKEHIFNDVRAVENWLYHKILHEQLSNDMDLIQEEVDERLEQEDCPRCIKDYDDEDGTEHKGEKKPSDCPQCYVCVDCEHMMECKNR